MSMEPQISRLQPCTGQQHRGVQTAGTAPAQRPTPERVSISRHVSFGKGGDTPKTGTRMSATSNTCRPRTNTRSAGLSSPLHLRLVIAGTKGRPGPGKRVRSKASRTGSRWRSLVGCASEMCSVLCPDGPSLPLLTGCPRFVEPRRIPRRGVRPVHGRGRISRRKNPEKSRRPKEAPRWRYLSSSLEEGRTKAFGPLFVDADGQAEPKRKMVEARGALRSICQALEGSLPWRGSAGPK